jgi:RNA polymerase sigma factor (sigma-70 family)
VYSIPRRYGFPEADAEDVFQNVFAILLRRLPQLRDETRLSAWLITTTHRECWRTRAWVGRHGAIDEQTLPDRGIPDEADAARWEQQDLVRAALDRLGGRCRELLIALFQSPGRPDYEAISRSLGLPVGSIGPTRARCFDKLRPILESVGANEVP